MLSFRILTRIYQSRGMDRFHNKNYGILAKPLPLHGQLHFMAEPMLRLRMSDDKSWVLNLDLSQKT